MSITAIVLTVLAAAGLVLLLWAVGRAVTAAGNRIPPEQGRSRHYLAGRLDGVRIADILDYDGELLVSLTAPGTPLAGAFRVTAGGCSLSRVRRWHQRALRCAPTSAMTGPSCSPIPCWAATLPVSRPP